MTSDLSAPRVWGKRPNTVPRTALRRFSDPGHRSPTPGTGSYDRAVQVGGWGGTSRIVDPANRRARNRKSIAEQRAQSRRDYLAGGDLVTLTRDRRLARLLKRLGYSGPTASGVES